MPSDKKKRKMPGVVQMRRQMMSSVLESGAEVDSSMASTLRQDVGRREKVRTLTSPAAEGAKKSGGIVAAISRLFRRRK